MFAPPVVHLEVLERLALRCCPLLEEEGLTAVVGELGEDVASAGPGADDGWKRDSSQYRHFAARQCRDIQKGTRNPGPL